MAIIGATISLLGLPAAAPAQERCGRDYRPEPGIGCAKREGGGYHVRHADGHGSFVHGVDPEPEHHCRGSHKKRCQPPPPPPPPPPGKGCATDYFQHFLYGYPSGTTNGVSGVRSSVQTWVSQMDAKLSEASIESGGPGATFKVLCTADGLMRMDAFPVTGGGTFSEVVSSARAAGFTASNAHYSILYDGTGACGVANVGGFNAAPRYAVTWRRCWGWHTLMHENAHNQGAVSNSAPNATGGWHGRDEYDVMSYDDGGPTSDLYYPCPEAERFDCRHDDFFDSAPEADEQFLSDPDAWNLGSRSNRFIAFAAS